VARAIHDASPRSKNPFIAVDCGAIPEALLESQLFGHDRGAFTGADRQTAGEFGAAEGGTLFLDEISNMALAFQAKLLRVLQERVLHRVGSTKSINVDVRVLAASNRNLEELCETGSFRRDLYFRLNEYTISIPPLRKRREDILFLAKRFLDITNLELGKSIRGLSPSTTEAILNYDWPGNVRQLRSVVRRAVLVGEDIITEEHIGLKRMTREPWAENGQEAASPAGGGGWEGMPLREVVGRNTARLERRVIAQALRRTGGNKAKAARLLQVDYKTLHSKVKEYGIPIEGEQLHA